MNIEISVLDRRSGITSARGRVVGVLNNYNRGDTRLLSFSLDTGYEVKVYLSQAEMEELLSAFPKENIEIGNVNQEITWPKS